MTEDEILAIIERDAARSTEAVRAMLREAGRLDLLAELETRLRDTRLGLDSARNCWHSISPAQRRALEIAALGPLRRLSTKPSRYVINGDWHDLPIRLPTIRNLCAHELLAPDGGALDPERTFVITERGRFVLAHGRPIDVKPGGAQ